MFDKLKQLKQLKNLQGSIENEQMTVEENRVKVTMNGKLEIEEITINDSLDKEQHEEAIKSCVNKAIKELQQVVLSKMVSNNPFQ